MPFKIGHSFGKRFQKGQIPWNKKGLIIKRCVICEKEFRIKFYRKNTARFCSRKCHGKSIKGKPFFNSTGIPSWNKNTKGIMPPQCGFQKGHKSFPGTIEALQKWIKENGSWSKGKSNIYVIGDKNVNWKNGITPENEKIRKSLESKLWHRACLERNNFTCQKYLIRGGKLRVHHIQNFAQYPELRFAIDNGITLSEKAHREFHKIYGKKNNNKEQLEEFLCHK